MKKNLLILSILVFTTGLFAQTYKDHRINNSISLPNASCGGDFDNDGDIDIISVSGNGEIVIYKNDGNQIFDDAVYVEDYNRLNPGYKNIGVGDLNSDGYIDFVVNSTGENKIYFYKNLGNLSFQKIPHSSSISPSDKRIIIADMENDGDLDIFINNLILINTGVFSFQEQIITTASSVQDFRCSDINGDNLIDFFAAMKYNLGIYIQNENHEFTEAILSSEAYSYIDIADINADGYKDIIASKTSNQRSVLFLNNGDHSFSNSDIHYGKDINLNDVDGDNAKDLIYTYSSDNTGSEQNYRFSIILNENIFDFNSSTDIIVMNDNIHSNSGSLDLSFTDFNNDGAQDIIQTIIQRRVQLFLSDLSASNPFLNLAENSIEVSNNSNNVEDISYADLDGDGDLDVISSSAYDQDLEWYQNNGSSYKTYIISKLSWVQQGHEPIDLDNDGDIDIVSYQYGNDFSYAWHENDGNGNFTIHYITAIGNNQPEDVKVADFDNDNDIDILALGNDDCYILYNDGNESFSAVQLSELIYAPYAVELYDLNDDNYIDIVLHHSRSSNKISWYENGPTGFEPLSVLNDLNVNISSGAIEIGDIDNDNDLDIIFAYASEIKYLINDGTLNFSLESNTINNIGTISDIELMDINSDGFIDFYVSTNTGIYQFINDQSKGLIKKDLLIDSPFANTKNIQLTDYDNDSDNDLLYGSGGGGRIGWLELTSLQNTILWTGGSNNSWNSVSNWTDNQIPTPTDNVIIPSNLSKYPTLSATTTINDLKLESDASLKGQENLTINGTLTIERQITGYSSSSDGWHFLSSPVSNQTISGSDFVPSSGDDLYEWGESTGEWLNYSVGSFGDSQFEAGKGYLVAYNNTATKEFTGNFNTGTVTKNLTYTAGMGDGWNLLGNPYPSAIDWDLITRSGDVDDAAYIVNPLDGTYKSWVEGVGDITDGEIPVNQGFFVKANSGGQSVTMELANQVHSSNNFNKSTNALPENTLKISLNGVNSENNTYVRFKYDATEHFDSHSDAYKLFGFAEIPQVYTHLGETDYSINALNFSTEAISIPLGIYPNAEEDLSFQFTGLEGFDGNTRIELEDKTANKIIHLREQSSYNFRGSTSDEAERFVLHFSQVTGLEDIAAQDAQVYAAAGRVYIRLEEGAQYSQMRLFDLSGRLLREQALSKQSLQSIDLSDLKGVYLVQLQGEDGSITEKVTL